MTAVYTHHPVLRYLAVCETQGCGWREECISEIEAVEEITDHKRRHGIDHTCYYDEHAGWLGEGTCRGCRYEQQRRRR